MNRVYLNLIYSRQKRYMMKAYQSSMLYSQGMVRISVYIINRNGKYYSSATVIYGNKSGRQHNLYGGAIMEKKPYSDSRWWDNPMPVDSACGNCRFYQGFLKCEKYSPKIPMNILDKSFPGTAEFDENYCTYRTEI